MNGTFFHEQAAAVARLAESEPDASARLKALYRRVFARDPSAKEIDLGLSFLTQGTLEEYAKVMLATNEVLFQK